MELYQVSGSGSQIGKRQTGAAAGAGSSHVGERHFLRSPFRLCLAPAAQRFWPLANGLCYFRQWTQDWTWRFIHDGLRDCLRKVEGRNVAPTAAIIDSQSVKTAEQAGERGYDAGKNVNGRKRHILVDCLGMVLGVVVHSAGIQDRDGARVVKILSAAQKSLKGGGAPIKLEKE